MGMKASPTESLGLYDLKQHIPWFHEEYWETSVQIKQTKLQLVTGPQPKQCRESEECRALSL
jgi:hypothetical protein